MAAACPAWPRPYDRPIDEPTSRAAYRVQISVRDESDSLLITSPTTGVAVRRPRAAMIDILVVDDQRLIRSAFVILAKSQWRGRVRDATPATGDRVPVNA